MLFKPFHPVRLCLLFPPIHPRYLPRFSSGASAQVDARSVPDNLTGKMSPGAMITSKISLENVVEDGIKELIKNKEKHVKVLVQI